MVFSLGRRVGPFDYIVISLTPTGGDKLSAILQDDSGRSRMRYLPPLKPGERNLIVLNRLGFPGQDGLGASIRSVSLSLFTNPQDPDFNVDVHGVFVARNIVDLMSVIEREEPVFMPVD